MGNRQLFPMSFDQYQQVKNQSTIVTGTPEAQMVKQSGARIQKAVEQYFMDLGQPDYLNEYEWEFNLIAEETINAWCMPGGKVAFYSGIMPICQDELGVAVVMGHEIAHAIANHGAERMSQQYAAQTGLTLANILLGNDQNESVGKNLLLQAAGVGTSLGILAFSRKHESEADQLGLYFMAMAGYDPREAPKFWERMASASGGAAPPEFLSTHPSDSRRIRDLQANMETALQYYESSQ
ncbi:MAG: M48 family metallopeptidase [Bacteroidota bacterium]